MILSMTGYGKAETNVRGKKLVCEIRSLNSKSMDLSVSIEAFGQFVDGCASVSEAVYRPDVTVAGIYEVMA